MIHAQQETNMVKKILLVAALVAKLTGVALLHDSMVAAEDCTPCPDPCWPGTACGS
jgi:hypothetical protein